MKLSIALLLLLALALPAFAQQSLPLAKAGSCPCDYRESGNYCMPISAQTPPAISKSASVRVVGDNQVAIASRRGLKAANRGRSVRFPIYPGSLT
jgi:hypothetical protein